MSAAAHRLQQRLALPSRATRSHLRRQIYNFYTSLRHRKRRGNAEGAEEQPAAAADSAAAEPVEPAVGMPLQVCPPPRRSQLGFDS